jgi:3-hydroxyacyl-[acyl-carrier-protein] dehydratase
MSLPIPLPVYDLEILYACLPHRSPMLMVDCLLEYEGNTGLAGLTITRENVFVDKENRLSETGLIEHMAQSVALYAGFSYWLQKIQPPIGYIGSIQNLEVYKCPSIGEKIRTQINILQEFAGISLVEIESLREGKFLARGQMKTVVLKSI